LAFAKKLGTVLRSMDRGIGACDTLMKYLFLWLLLALAECVAVCIIFGTYFHYAPLSIAVFGFVFSYGVLTIFITSWRKNSVRPWPNPTTSGTTYQTVSQFQYGTLQVQASLTNLNNSQQVLYQSCLATCLALAIQKRLDCCAEYTRDSLCLSHYCCQGFPASICNGMEVGDFVAVLTANLSELMATL